APRRSPPPRIRAGTRARASRRSSPGPSACAPSLGLPRVDVHDRLEELDRLLARPLEGVAPDDRSEAAAVPDAPDLVEDRGGVLRLPAGEDHDAPAVEGALHHVPHPLGERRDRDALLVVDLLGGRLLDVRRRQLHLDDVRAELAGDLRRVGDDVDRGLALLGEPRAARVGPDDDGEALPLGLLAERPDLLVHRVPQGRSGIDREADRGAPEPERLVDAARERWARLTAGEAVGVVELQDQRDLAGELRRARLEEPERRRVGVAPRADRQLEVVARVVAGGIRGERACRSVLESLIDGQDDEATRAPQAPVAQQAREARARAGAVARIPAENLADS